MKSSNALVTINSNANIRKLGELLYGKVIPNCACSVPNEVMNILQSYCFIDQVLEEIVNGFLPDSASTKADLIFALAKPTHLKNQRGT